MLFCHYNFYLNNIICHLCCERCLMISYKWLFLLCPLTSPKTPLFKPFSRTVRTWDVNNEKKHKSVFKPRSVQGKRVIPTTCTYSRDGKLIAAGCQDGSIQIWDRNMSVSNVYVIKILTSNVCWMLQLIKSVLIFYPLFPPEI